MAGQGERACHPNVSALPSSTPCKPGCLCPYAHSMMMCVANANAPSYARRHRNVDAAHSTAAAASATLDPTVDCGIDSYGTSS